MYFALIIEENNASFENFTFSFATNRDCVPDDTSNCINFFFMAIFKNRLARVIPG